MIGHGQKFTRKKEQAIAALLSHRTIEEAAHSVGISFATLKRWLKNPEFQAEYLRARRETVLQANARIQQHSGAAAAVLLKLMADPSTPASVKARAAQCIIEHANKSLHTDDLVVRIARLEESAETQK